MLVKELFIFNYGKIGFIGLDPGYVEYLKSKKQKALEAERAMTDEQKQSKILSSGNCIFLENSL